MNNTVQLGLNWWNTWRERSVNTRIFGAMVTIGGFTVLVKLAAAAKEVVVAYQFGTNDALDAYLIALLLPTFGVNIVAGALNEALVPTYIQVRENEGPEAAQRLFSNVIGWSTALLIGIAGLLLLTASYTLPLFGSSFSPEKLALTRWLFLLLIPLLVFGGLATTLGGVLNAGQRFALTAIAPMGTSVITVIGLLVVGKFWGIYALAGGMVCGAAMEAMILAWGLRRQGVSLMPRWDGMNRAMKQVLYQYVPAVGSAFLVGCTSIVAASMAAMFGPGSVSALAYGTKITTLIVDVGVVAVGTAVLPHFSQMVALQDWSGMRHTLITYARLVLFVTLPITVILIYFSEPLVALCFQRGAFGPSDTHLVGRIQALFLLQVPLAVLSRMLVRLICSLKANHLLFWGSAIKLTLFVAFNYVFMKSLGVEGIALSTSLVFLTSCCYLLWVSLRLMRTRFSLQPRCT